MDERRLRAWRALELGPLWRPRQEPAPASTGEPVPAASVEPAPAETPAVEGAAPEALVRESMPKEALARESVPKEHPRPPQPDPQLPEEPHLLPAGASPVAGMDWPALRAAVAGCQACRLCETRNNTVFGVGPEDARWLVIGEGPGAEEDASGEPFVGQAGRLLDAMLTAIGLDRRRNVFIANVVKCRPPKNRNPHPDEIQACLPYLRRQIELLAPDIVLLLGRVAANALLENDLSVTRMRGRVQTLRVGERRIPAVVTWHPSYLLRRPEEKALSWADLCMAQARMEAGSDGGA